MEREYEQDIILLDLPATHQYLNVLGACLVAMLNRIEGVQEREAVAYNVELAVHETCTNIVQHAYADYKGRIQVTISVQQDPLRLVIEMRDKGKAFNLAEVSAPSLTHAQVHGYGLFLTRQLVDEVEYFPKAGDNRWRLVKHLRNR